VYKVEVLLVRCLPEPATLQLQTGLQIADKSEKKHYWNRSKNKFTRRNQFCQVRQMKNISKCWPCIWITLY